jgi:Domain of unknown function (DUF2017)
VSGTSFGRRRGRVVLKVEEAEVPLLRDLFGQLADLLEPAEDLAETDDDPLAAMVGIGTSTQLPDDPALARLLPDAHPDDPEASAEFRRYTELGIRDTKRERVGLVLKTLDRTGKSRQLSEEETQAWLTSLNDLRLVLGTRLDVSEDPEEDWAELGALPPEDPRLVHHAIYDWLGGLQWRLLQALT